MRNWCPIVRGTATKYAFCEETRLVLGGVQFLFAPGTYFSGLDDNDACEPLDDVIVSCEGGVVVANSTEVAFELWRQNWATFGDVHQVEFDFVDERE